MSKWIAEFDLEDGDTMPEHMDLEYKGVRIDFHCKPQDQEPILNKIKSIIAEWKTDTYTDNLSYECMIKIAEIIDKAESEKT
jgi:hypothetical protein